MGSTLRITARSPGDFRGALLLAPLLLCLPATLAGNVVISEIHYHPSVPDGKTLEFVELHNPSGAEIPLAGWEFVEGIEFEFPPEARIDAGGYVAVVRDIEVFRTHFGIAGGGVFGNFRGALDNGGEEIVLADASGAVIDAVDFDDRAPWPVAADGDGPSIQRLCATSPGHRAENWRGGTGDAPTPLAPNLESTCPAPERAPPRVAISEIHYHPADDNDEREEYVELHNPADTAISLAGWKLEGGIEFEFPDGNRSLLPPGGYLVVCRDEDYLRKEFGITTTVGDFEGSLSNRGERIALVDRSDRLVDVVRYRDRGHWPHGADGEGRSLERLVLSAPGDDPANWGNSNLGGGDGFLHICATGELRDLFSQRVVLGINGPGEFIVDNVVLERLSDPGTNLIPAGDFEISDPWILRGIAADSRIEDGIGINGSAGLRLISTGSCPDECLASDSVSNAFQLGALAADDRFRLCLDYRHVSGSTAMYAFMLQGLEVNLERGTVTPARPSSRPLDRLPPFFSHRGRFPQEPTSADRVWLSARLRTAPGTVVDRVVVTYVHDTIERTLTMADDGQHRDGFAGDGVYGVELGNFPHNSQVLYRFLATTSEGPALFPRPTEAGEPTRDEIWGFYVNDDQATESILPVYHVLLPGIDPADPRAINQALNCRTLENAAFAFRGELYPFVGLRFRGNTACLIKKRNLKFRFNRGRFFRGVRKLNLQGLWTDKSLVREHLAWDFMRELGVPYCETEYLRVHLNGAYHGLFLYLEHPDRQFLERNGLDPAGFLYKAKQPPRVRPGQPPPIGVSRKNTVEEYMDLWEEETREDGDFRDIAGFIGALHDDGDQPGGPTVEFMSSRVHEEMLIGYQIGQVVLNNIDSFAKNHFLYRASGENRWGPITWDMDLVFGKFFDPDVVNPDQGREVGTLNDCMLSPAFDLNPWFTTTVLGFALLNHLQNFFLRAGGGHYQRAYLVRLRDILEEKYTNQAYDPRLDELEELLREEQEEDLARWGRYPSNPGCVVPPDMHFHIETIKTQLRFHREFLLNFLNAFHRDLNPSHPEFDDHDRMKITEVLFNAPGAGDDLEFLEILNTSGRPIDLTGWTIRGGIEFDFPAGTRVEKDELILVVRSRARFAAAYPRVVSGMQVLGDYSGKLSNEGEVIRLRDGGPGHPATVDYLAYGDGPPWPDVRDGLSIELTGVSRNRDNDRPEAWILSSVPGGTPGNFSTRFRRGDSSADGAVNLSDAIFNLQYLFQGGPPPSCADAADADDDGGVSITDAVFLLNYLFLGGLQPPAPFPGPGIDPTPDGLLCF